MTTELKHVFKAPLPNLDLIRHGHWRIYNMANYSKNPFEAGVLTLEIVSESMTICTDKNRNTM